MEADDEKKLAERITALEAALADLSRRFDSHFESARPVDFSIRTSASDTENAAFGFQNPSSAEGNTARQPRPQPRGPAAAPRTKRPAENLKSKGAEWWLARGGALLTLFALVLLYQYAVDRNWITPMLRIAMGTAVGVALMVTGLQLKRAPATRNDVIGLREVLLGAALSAWYISAYAAAVFYSLISLSTARILFLILTIVGAWLALKEKRALLALLSLGVGFATPALLPSPAPSIPQFALYLGALTVVGLILYLMRGWQSILWLTFGAFWWSTGAATTMACCAASTTGTPVPSRNSQIALTILIAVIAVAMIRVPILRRRLLALGSNLYTESSRPDGINSALTELAKNMSGFTGQPAAIDSAALWIVTLAAPLIGVAQLSIIWPAAPTVVWGLIILAAAAVAYRLASSPRAPNEEFTHVEATAAALWSLAGVLWLANSIAVFLGISGVATSVIGASIHAFVSLRYMRNSPFVMPARIARATAFAIIVTMLLREAGTTQGLDPYWTFAEACGIAVAAWIAWTHGKMENTFTSVMAIAAYVALLVVDARVLGTVLRPLVTASYAVIGTALLVLSRATPNQALLRRVGGLTLVVVVGRLLLLDLAGVETIWRVLLFLGIGALFLFTSHRMQSSRNAESATAGPVS